MSRVALAPELSEQVEKLYALAKAGEWRGVWLAVAGESELAVACSRHVEEPSGWSFLHCAAHCGDEGSARALIRLGATLTLKSGEGTTAADVARERGHADLSSLLTRAEVSSRDLWAPPRLLNHLPSSSAWDEAQQRRAWRERRIAYGGGVVVIPAGARYFVDSFERTLIGWHGSYNPPRGMDDEPMP